MEILDDKKKPLTEKILVERLLDIRNCAILRLRTCMKYAMSSETEQMVQDHEIKAKQYLDGQFATIIEKSMLVSSNASKKRIATIFRAFDEILDEEGYDISELGFLKSDLNAIFGSMASKYSESKLGSERSAALLDGLRRRLPRVYQQIMDQYRTEAKKQERKKKQDMEKKLLEVKR